MTFQDHFHLSTALQSSGELAPTLKWRSHRTSYSRTPVVIAAAKENLSGALTLYRLQDSGGVVRQTVYNLTTVVDADFGGTFADRQTALLGMQGALAFFVDHEHPNDSADHSAYVKPVYVEFVGNFTPAAPPNPEVYDVAIRLREAKFTDLLNPIAAGLLFQLSGDGVHWQNDTRTILAVADGAAVGASDNRIPNGYHVYQTVSGSRPLLKLAILNGLPVLRFDGTDDCLINSAFPDFGDTYTVFAVAKYATAGSADTTQAILDVGTGAADTGFELGHAATARWRGTDSTQTREVAGGDLRNDSWHIHTGHNTGSGLQYWRDGVSVGTVAYTAPNPNMLDELRIGRNPTAGWFLWGDLAELLIYTRTLSDAERAHNWRYLEDKWGL